MKKIIFCLAVAATLCLAGCANVTGAADSGASGSGSGSSGSGNGTSESSGSGNNSQANNTKSYTTTDLGITETDLGSAWSLYVTLDAGFFTNMKAGDYITITTEASAAEGTSYQICFADSSWNKFGSDNECTNATFDSKYKTYNLTSAAQETKYTPSESEIENLKAGNTYVTGCYVKITKITVSIASAGESSTNVTADVCDANATNNTKKVMKYLKDIYGNKMLTGVMDCSWSSSIDMEAKVYNETGKYPALEGFDFSSLLKSDSKTWFTPNQITKAETAWNKGSLVTFCWHWLDPTATSGNGASYAPDEIAFRIPYDESTGKLDESSTNFTYIKNDLDTVASYLSDLQDNGVVVIWRPLHEAKGNCGLYPDQDTGEPTGTAWFWWGAGNSCEANGTKVKDAGTENERTITTYSVSTDEDLCAASYLALWKYMYTYFTETKGLHNLIWLWNGQGAKWYPGDDYCDLVGYDIYDSTNANGAGQSFYNNLMSWCSSSKMAAISECGYVPSTTAVQASTAKWLYYMVWNDDDNLADDTSDDNDNFWGGTAYNSTAAKTTNSYSTDFTIKRGDSDLKALFTSMGVTISE